jgi:hypothetical protein
LRHRSLPASGAPDVEFGVLEEIDLVHIEPVYEEPPVQTNVLEIGERDGIVRVESTHRGILVLEIHDRLALCIL